MGTEKLCACDRTCESLIRADIEFVDTVKLPFTALLKDLSKADKDGLWLNPFRGIPPGSHLSRFDVIYLDENCRVLEFAENFTEVEFEPFHGEAASALILPAHSLGSFQIRKADQLRICRGEKVLAGSDEAAFSAGNEESRCVRNIGLRTPQAQTIRYQQPATNTETAAGDWIEEKPSLTIRLLRWLFGAPASINRRRGDRLPAPGLVAYYWTGGEPKAYQLGNVSHSGLYLLTEERWIPGTRIVMTLQKGIGGTSNSQEISRVESKVVRWGEDGVGCEFIESGFFDLNTGEIVQERKFDFKAFDRFLQGARNSASGARHSTIQ